MNKRIRKKKGLSKVRDEELWSLDYTITKFILPRLEKFRLRIINDKNMLVDTPQKIYEENKELTEKEITNKWVEVLDKIIYAFRYKMDKNNFSVSLDYLKENKNRHDEGMQLFIKYYDDLWE